MNSIDYGKLGQFLYSNMSEVKTEDSAAGKMSSLLDCYAEMSCKL